MDRPVPTTGPFARLSWHSALASLAEAAQPLARTARPLFGASPNSRRVLQVVAASWSVIRLIKFPHPACSSARP